MARKNINAILRYVKEFVDGKMSRTEFETDFPFEFESRLEGIEEEDPAYSEFMNQYLFEEGLERSDGMSDEDFRELMLQQYQEVRDGIY